MVDERKISEKLEKIDSSLASKGADLGSRVQMAFKSISPKAYLINEKPLDLMLPENIEELEKLEFIANWYVQKYKEKLNIYGYLPVFLRNQLLYIRLESKLCLSLQIKSYPSIKEVDSELFGYIDSVEKDFIETMTENEKEIMFASMLKGCQFFHFLNMLNLDLYEEVIRNFLMLGTSDLKASLRLMKADVLLPNPTMFSAQQAVEKYLKGFYLYLWRSYLIEIPNCDPNNSGSIEMALEYIKVTYSHDVVSLSESIEAVGICAGQLVKSARVLQNLVKSNLEIRYLMGFHLNDAIICIQEMLTINAEILKELDSTGKITRQEDVCGGDARIGNTRITVASIIAFYKLGSSIEKLLDIYPWLTKVDIIRAFMYYGTHKQEVDSTMELKAGYFNG